MGALAEFRNFDESRIESGLTIVRLVYNRTVYHRNFYFAPKVLQDPFNLRRWHHNWLTIGESCRFATNSHSLILILKVNILTLELTLNR